MTRFLNRSKRPLLILIALMLLCLPAMQPFLQGMIQNQMPRTDDGTLHLYRSVALDYSLQHDGAIYPRYSSGLVTGYGAALFNYFPPTSYYPAALIGSPATGYVQAWLWSMMLWILLAAGGAFCLGRFWAGDGGGFITAAAYVYAPYMLFDAVTRGTSSELAGLALLPWALWGFSRLAYGATRRDFLAAVVSFALFIPMHNIVTLHGTALLSLYCLFLAWRAPNSGRAFVQMVAAGVLSLLLTAFFWWPALAETDYTKISGVTANLNSIDVTQSLRHIGDVLALPHTADQTQLRAPVPITLGWPQMLLAGAGLLLTLAGRTRRRDIQWLQGFLVLLTGLVVFLQLELSAPLWETLPLIGFTQFAWRTMGLPSLTLALLAGIGTMQLLQQIKPVRVKYMVYAGGLLGVMLYSLPWLYTSYVTLPADDITDAQAYEAQRGELTLSSYSEYLPFWNQAELDPDALRNDFRTQPGSVPRLMPSDAVTVTQADYTGTAARLTLNATDDTQLIFNWLYMPGWTATLNDMPLPVQPTAPDGKISLAVPAGTHDVHLHYAGTNLQHRTEWLSLIALLAVGGVLIFWRNPSANNENPHDVLRSGLSVTQLVTVTVAVSVGLVACKTLFLDNAQTLIKRERFAQSISAGADTVLDTNFGGEITLLGATVPQTIPSGEALMFDAFWTVPQPTDTNYSALYRLLDASGHVISETRRYQPGDYASENWLPGYYVADSVQLPVPDYTPPTAYTLQAAVYEAESGDLISIINSAGNPAGVYLDITEIQVMRPASQPAPPDYGIASDSANSQLLDFDGIPQFAQVGDEITFEWLWRLQEATGINSQVRVVWLGTVQNPVAESDFMPLTTGYPVTAWQPGDVWRGVHSMYVPGTLSEGRYLLWLHVGRPDDLSLMQIPLQTIQITTPQRTYELPDNIQPLNHTWQNGIRLRGYEIEDNRIRFYWQTDELLRQNLRYFVHVLDNSETIIAQSDGIPGDWQRPTPGWNTDEIVRTDHAFDAPVPGIYPVRVGWYNPRTGERVQLDSGKDALFLDGLLDTGN